MEECSTSLDGVVSTDRTALTFITNTNPLGPDNPIASISFSSFWGPTEAFAYAMDDDFSAVLVPSDKFTLITEPTSAGLLGAALLALGALRRRRAAGSCPSRTPGAIIAYGFGRESRCSGRSNATSSPSSSTS